MLILPLTCTIVLFSHNDRVSSDEIREKKRVITPTPNYIVVGYEQRARNEN